MKKYIIKLIMLCLFQSSFNWNSFSQNLPDYYHNGNYTFERSWVDSLNRKESRWSLADWTFAGNLCEFNPSAGSISNGKLNLTIEKKNSTNMGKYPAKPYWGAEYGTTSPMQYGRFIVNLKPSVPSGVVTSFFLNYIYWNNDYTIPQEWYEIDIEFAGKSNEVQFTVHWIDATGKHHEAETIPLDFDASAAFHEWAIEWTPTYISFFVDDEQLYSITDPVLLKEQQHAQNIQMNNWVSDAPSWVGPFDEASLPVVAQYDYIAYYSLTNPSTSVKENNPYSILVLNNDSTKQIEIKGDDTNAIQYKLSDVNGKMICEGRPEGGIISKIDNLANGIYLLELRKNDWTGTYKIKF